MDVCRSRRARLGYREGSKWLCSAKTRGKAQKSGPKIVGEIFGCNVDNNHDQRISITGVDFHFDRIRFDAADGGGTDLGQHGHCYESGREKAQCVNELSVG